MMYVYRLGLGKWALLCVLFIGGALLAIHQYPDGFDPNTLPPTSAGIPLQQSECRIPLPEHGLQHLPGRRALCT